jgi:WD repeat-containing protein 44
VTYVCYSLVQDTVLRIWVLKSAYNYFKDMRNRYNADVKSSPTNSYETVISDQIASEEKSHKIFVDSPFCSYSGEHLKYIFSDKLIIYL